MPPTAIAHAKSLRAARRSSVETATVIPSHAGLVALFRQMRPGSSPRKSPRQRMLGAALRQISGELKQTWLDWSALEIDDAIEPPRGDERASRGEACGASVLIQKFESS